MNKKNWTIIILISIGIISVPYIVYFLYFKDYSVSTLTIDWANFGTYLNGVLVPLIMLIGLLISYVISKNNERTNEVSILRQEMRERPLLFITYKDFNESVSIIMINKGIGTLIVKEYYFIEKATNEKYPGIYEVMEKPEYEFGYFTSSQKDLILMPGESREIFHMEYDKKDDKNDYEQRVERVRYRLKDFSINVLYTDLYGNKMPAYSKDLKMFGRHF